jgi:hypothetical protein
VIDNWDDYLDALFVEDPKTGHWIWRRGRELRDQMTPKFRRMYDRKQRQVMRKSPEWRVAVGFSRRYVEVTARKHQARKRRRRP